jgi:hypothetical protein
MILFESEIIEVSLRVGDHDRKHLVALVTDLQRSLFVELGQFGPRTGYGNFYSAIFRRDFLSLTGEP